MVSPIHTDGQLIKDDLGNVMTFRGGHLSDSAGIWVTESLLQRIRDYGLNAWKTHVWMRDMMPTQGVINESYFSSILDDRVAWSKNLGLYFVIQLNLNFSQDYLLPNWLKYGAGAKQSRTDFWAKNPPQEKTQDYVIQVFKYMAARYADEPHVIFSWFNDNYGGYQTPSEFGIRNKVFSENCIDAIRSAETVQHLIIVELGLIKGFGYVIDEQPDVNRANVAWAARGYNWGFGNPPWSDYTESQKNWLEALFTRYESKFRVGYNKPFIITEFGVPCPSEDVALTPTGWQQHLDDVFTWFDAHKLHWFYWQNQNEPRHPSPFYWCLFYHDGSEKPVMTYAKQYFPVPLEDNIVVDSNPQGIPFTIEAT